MIARKISFALLILSALSSAAGASDDSADRLTVARQMMALSGFEREVGATLHSSALAYAQRWRIANPSLVDSVTQNCVAIAYEQEMRSTLPGLIEEEAHVYAKTYSLPELQYMAKYYQTPMGQQITAKHLQVFQENQALQTVWIRSAAGRAVKDAGMQSLYEKSVADRVAADVDSYERAPFPPCKLKAQTK